MGTQQYSLRWNNYLRHITCAFDSLRGDKDLVDVTLSCDGRKLQAHKMLLSACSSYFRDLFKENPCQHPVVIFRNVPFDDLLALIDFMYHGEVNVEQEQLASFLNTAELLQVQGLTNSGTSQDENDSSKEIDTQAPEVQFGGKRSSPERSERYISDDNSQTPGPSAKRQKRRTRSPSPMTQPSTSLDTSADRSQSCCTPIDFVPVKVEAVDYDERLQDSELSDDLTDNTLARLRDNQELLLTKSSEATNLENLRARNTDPLEIVASGIEGEAMAGPSNDPTDNLPPGFTTSRPSNYVVALSYGFSCRICGRLFNHRDSCQKHMAMHLGTSKCRICFCVLSRKSHMKRHLKNVHGIDEDNNV